MEIEGLDELARNLDELQRALGDLDGDIAHLSFDPHDPESIEQAIQQFCSAVDEKIAGYGNNEILLDVADEFKEAGRSAIIEQAAAARLADEDGS